jgi:drug/metabolite transporter (DMT)-like permease
MLPSTRGAASGLGAAFLFGLSTPFAKLLLPGSGPFMLAGLLYLGSAVGLVGMAPWRQLNREAPLRTGDLPALFGVVLAGGLVAPVLLMYGLARLPGSTASLLLNLEAPFTVALAVLIFGESLSPREALGAAVIVLGGTVLGLQGGGASFNVGGFLALSGACLGWALDNNLSQRLSLRGPVAVVRVKACLAGAVNVALALATGDHFPAGPRLAGALATGFLGYGVSIVLHMRAMREIGAARQAGLFATAPFAGALASVPLLGEHPSLREMGAASAMALGVAVMLSTRHGHEHVHGALGHEHLHAHDEHHQHGHDAEVSGVHSHVHQHVTLVHDHPHTPDAHHRHGH